MDYQKVGTPIQIHFESNDLDLLQIGILNKSLHDLLNQTAISILNQYSEIEQARGNPKAFDYLPITVNREDILIRGRLTNVSVGSINIDLQPYVASVLSTAGAYAILQNLSASLILSILAHSAKVIGVKAVRIPTRKFSENISVVRNEKRLSNQVSKLLKDLSGSTNGGKIYIRSGDEEILIELNPTKD